MYADSGIEISPRVTPWSTTKTISTGLHSEGDRLLVPVENDSVRIGVVVIDHYVFRVDIVGRFDGVVDRCPSEVGSRQLAFIGRPRTLPTVVAVDTSGPYVTLSTAHVSELRDVGAANVVAQSP